MGTFQAAADLRLRPECCVADLGKMLTTLEVAPLFPSARALPFGLMLDDQQPGSELVLVVGGGFEPPKASPTDLQSVPFGHSGTPPRQTAPGH
jgi:hypothetical protein